MTSVVNVRDGIEAARWDMYVGRGRCPCRRRLCTHGTGLGNPYTVEEHGPDAMLLYIDHVAHQLRDASFGVIVERLRGKVLGCWCAPARCHGEVLARLADGDTIEAIRADWLAGRRRSSARQLVAAPPEHHCHARGCKVAVPPRMLMCRPHWRRVPKPLQNAVWAHFRPGQEIRKDPTREYLAAAEAAIRAVAILELRERQAEIDAQAQGEMFA